MPPPHLFFNPLNKGSSTSPVKQTVIALLSFYFCCIFTGCNTAPTLDSFASQHDLIRSQLNADGFRLSTLSRTGLSSHSELRIYIDGDGRPWQGAQPADNPTGRGSMVIELMLADQKPAVFLTRPCYYLLEMPASCKKELWTSARYSERVVEAMADAIIQLHEKHASDSLTLIGYSGGGVLALLTAARLGIPTTVVTVAANLDIAAWTEFHGLLPLEKSLNPAEQDFSNSNIAQRHLLAGRDNVVPPKTIKVFRANNPQAEYRLFEAFDHRCCWLENWPEIVADY